MHSLSQKFGKLDDADTDFANCFLSFILASDRFIFNLKIFTRTFGGGLAPSNQTMN
jgi:hypothetical protein